MLLPAAPATLTALTSRQCGPRLAYNQAAHRQTDGPVIGQPALHSMRPLGQSALVLHGTSKAVVPFSARTVCGECVNRTRPTAQTGASLFRPASQASRARIQQGLICHTSHEGKDRGAHEELENICQMSGLLWLISGRA